MLKLFRHRSFQKNVYIGLAVAVVLSFVVSGVLLTNDGGKRSSAALAQLGKHSISVQDYLNSYRAVQNQASWMYGDKLAEMRGRINFKGEARDRILLLDRAKQEGIRADDKEVVQWIATQPAFQHDGKFDEKFYEMYIERALRNTPQAFEEDIRQMLTIQKLVEKTSALPTLTDEEAKKRYIQEKGEKKIIYGIMPWENFQDQVTVEDKDIQQLYDLVKDKLTAPEQVKVSYLIVPKEKAATMDEKAGTLADVAKQFGLEVKQSPYFSKNDSVPDLSGIPQVIYAIFNLSSVGQESDWIPHDGGKTRVRLEDKKPERLMTLDEAKNELVKEFKKDKASGLAVERLKTIKDKVQNGDLETALKAEKIDPVTLEKYTKGVYPAGIYPSDSLEKAVNAMKEGDVSEAFLIPKGAMIVKLVQRLGADDKKFEEEKEAFKKELATHQSQEAINTLLEKLRKDLKLNLELMKEIFPSE